jgi:hypothetical protein
VVAFAGLGNGRENHSAHFVVAALAQPSEAIQTACAAAMAPVSCGSMDHKRLAGAAYTKAVQGTNTLLSVDFDNNGSFESQILVNGDTLLTVSDFLAPPA